MRLDTSNEIIVNARYRAQKVTGVQRYANEITSRLENKIGQIQPEGKENLLPGQIWEQCILPFRMPRNSVLWSPANLGPILWDRHVVTIHDLATFDHPEWFETKFAFIYKLLLPKIARSASKIITVSEFSKSRIIERLKIEPEKIHVTYLGSSNLKDDRNISIAKYDCPYFLYVGSLEPRKNLSRLFDAWSKLIKLPQFNKNIKLKVVGMAGKSFSGTGFDKISDGIEICGYLDDYELDSLYRNAIALVYPSLYEGFGLPPLEAMSRKTPVITSVGTSMQEIVGEDGLLVNPYSVDEIYSAMLSLVENEGMNRELRIKGFEKSKNFSWDITAHQTLDILRSI